MDYYFRTRGKVFGPFSETLLQKMRDTRKIGPSTDVSDDGVHWKPASDFDLLYPKEVVPLPPPEPMEWNYSIDGSQGFGPVPQSTIVTLIQTRRLNARSYVWRQGEKARPIRKSAGFAIFLPTPDETGGDYVLWGTIAAVLLICISVLVYVLIQRGFLSEGENDGVLSREKTPGNNSGIEPTRESKPEKKSGIEPTRELKSEEVTERVQQSIAHIEGPGNCGSGFMIRSGIVATNYHVIEKIFIETAKVTFPAATGTSKIPHSARLLYADPERDIAFLAVNSDLPPLSLAKSDQIKPGREIFAFGSPDGLENAVSLGLLGSTKMVSTPNNSEELFYQLGISINAGNSGGPVIDRYCRVVGIVTLKYTGVEKNVEGIAFCIPAPNVREKLKEMESLTDSEKNRNNSKHRAQVALNMLTNVHECAVSIMLLESGILDENQVQVALTDVREKLHVMGYVFGAGIEKELNSLKRDSGLSSEFRTKISELHANCLDIRSHIRDLLDTDQTDWMELIELVKTGDRLCERLRHISFF